MASGSRFAIPGAMPAAPLVEGYDSSDDEIPSASLVDEDADMNGGGTDDAVDKGQTAGEGHAPQEVIEVGSDSSDEAEMEPPPAAAAPHCEGDLGSDSDFEYLVRRTQSPPNTKTPRTTKTAGRRKQTKQLSLRGMLEAGKARYDLPKPPRPDPRHRTAQRPVPRPRDPDLVPARFPPGVIHLMDNFNPDDIPVPGMAAYQQCYCVLRGDCRHDTCENARVHVYCDHTSCPFEGICGNGTRHNDSVQLMRLKNTDVYALQAAKLIPEGVIIGEYLGFLSLVPRDRGLRTPNDGFRLHYHEDRDAWGSQILCVDAKLGGTLMRFINHSCTPTARFYEVANEGGRFIVVVARVDIEAGEEVTVDYGDDLWFRCQCATCIDTRP